VRYDFVGGSFISAIIYCDINTGFNEPVNHSPANPSRAAGNQRNSTPQLKRIRFHLGFRHRAAGG
jgi:hypothetical protein